MRRLRCVVCLLLLTTSAGAQTQAARPDGAVGPTHPIAEQDMLEQIEGFLREKERSGELKRLEQAGIERARRSIEEPPGRTLPRAVMPRSWVYDPTIVVQQDVVVRGAGVLAKAGTRVNPLDYVPFAQFWVFFDAADREQVAFARRMLDERSELVKPIVVNGRWADVMRAWKTTVYFDQGGDGSKLIDRFGVRALPATLRRDGSVLRLDEIALRREAR